MKGKVAKVKGAKKLSLDYELRQIAGQKVLFTERGEGIAHELGEAKANGGTISFKPTLATDRKRTIEAEVIQDGLPREILTIARFKAPPLPKLKVSKLRAKRKMTSLKLSWVETGGASGYRAEVKSGSEVLFRVLTEQRKLSFAGTPADGMLTVSVQALSESRPPGPVAELEVKPPR